jgi:uncharacterized membrane protein
MIDAYDLLKFVHVLLAIIAVGFNASYGIWLARAGRDPAHLGHVLRGIKTLDDLFANPAYILLFVTGMLTAFVGNIPLETFWIAASIGLWAVVVLGGFLIYTPNLRRQIALVESGDVDSAEYRAVARRGTIMGIVLALLVIVIVFLMVTKPTL